MTVLVETFGDHACYLDGRGRNFSSQFGEDGLIAAALERYGIRNRCCFEVGASDGLMLSNTLALRADGWRAVLIESLPSLYKRLEQLASDTVTTVRAHINAASLERILADAGLPDRPDLGVVDIDGQEYHVLAGLRRFRPRLLLVEYAYGSEESGDIVPALGGPGQASLTAMVRLARELDYEPLAKTPCNLFLHDNRD